MFQKELKRRFLGPSYRKIVRPIIQKYKIKNISNSKIKKFQSDLEDIKLIAFLQIHNESKKGNLERVLNHISRFCDDIVIYDDGSTDNSYEIASKFTKNIIRSNKNNFKSELEHKQKLLELALSLNPDWIVWLDADEVFDREGENYGIKALCRYGQINGIDGFSFQEYNLWKNENQYRVDKHWHKLWQIRLWKNNRELKFDVKHGLHQKSYPMNLEKICTSDIKVIHYGFSSPERREQKYQMYRTNDPNASYLGMFKDEKGIKLIKFSRDWLPLSTLKITVVCLIYKSIGYIKFVLNSFNKYTKNAEFLFIANDATDKVKKFLKENKINHLVFENKNKEEHYLNRVYRAWNYGGMNASGDIIVFVNSDMAFSKNWLDNLLKNLTEKKIITSRLVESGKIPSDKSAISKNFGQTYNVFNENAFQKFVYDISENKLLKGGLYMPCVIYKDLFIKSGGYPIGNRVEKSGKVTPGDNILFYEKLKPMGIKHWIVCNSIVYHIQEGEMDEEF